MNFFFNKNKPPNKQNCGYDSDTVAHIDRNKNNRRPMKFPYTFSAKLAQFPYSHYWNHTWIFRYYVYGVIASIPVFMYISSLSNSPENVAKWAKIKRKEEEEFRHKFD